MKPLALATILALILIALIALSVLWFLPRFLVDQSLRGQQLTAGEQRVKAENDLRTLLQRQELKAEQYAKAENDLRTLLRGQQLTAEQRVKAENDLRTTLLQAVGGLVLLVGAIATWRQLQTSRQELHLSREGQITDRFTKAIDQLDHAKSLQVRLGAIYALERIARDSERDHWTIMEVLTAYVRQHAAWPPRTPIMEVLTAYTRQHAPGPPEDETPLQGEAEPKPKPAADIQAILTVLGRRAAGREKVGEEWLDLSATDLRGANLYKAHLEHAFLWDAHLEHANLIGANLKDAHLQRAVFWRADLYDANLRDADLNGSDLRGAIHLTDRQIASAKTDENTKLSDYVARPPARPT